MVGGTSSLGVLWDSALVAVHRTALVADRFDILSGTAIHADRICDFLWHLLEERKPMLTVTQKPCLFLVVKQLVDGLMGAFDDMPLKVLSESYYAFLVIWASHFDRSLGN